MKKTKEISLKIRGKTIALTSILSKEGEIKKGNFNAQEVQVLKVLSGDKVLTSRQIHTLMEKPPTDISSTRRAITNLKGKGLIFVPDRANCKITGRLVRRYQIQEIDLQNQLDLFGDQKEKPGKKILYFVAIVEEGQEGSPQILSFHIIEAPNQEVAKSKFKKASLYSYLPDQLTVIPFRDLKAGYKWENLPF